MPPVDLTVGGIALIPIIVAVVEIAKSFGLKVEWAPWLTGVLSVLGFALVTVVTAHPEFLQPVVTVLTAIVIFLSSTGFYVIGQRALGKK